MACNPTKIISALHDEKENINDIVREEIKTSNRLILSRIPDAGLVDRHSNQESVIYGQGKQASMAYRSMSYNPAALVNGDMSARDLEGRNGIFNTNINNVGDSACHGFCTIRFAQGYRIRGWSDYGLDVDTPIQCARELDGKGPSHVEGFFDAFRRNFTTFGMDNFSDNLQNLAILNGEANASVVGGDTFAFSGGGWQAPPTSRITIWFLQEYRDRIMAEMEMLAMPVPENWLLEVEMPEDDWFDAIQEHQIRRNALTASGTPMTHFEGKLFEDPKDKLKGRKYHDFGGIRCIFNNRPIRGFFKKIGTAGGLDQFEFVRVHHWLNDPGETGGVVLKPNHAYREDRILVEGVYYDMCTLVPHIDPKSFKRYRLNKPRLMDGVEKNMGVNYEVEIVDGAYIPNNIQGDKFGMAARHEFRFKTMFPEISGYIAYRHGRREGYTLSVTPRNLTAGPQKFSAPEVFRECDLIDPVTTASCASCGEVPTSDGDCQAAADVAAGVVGLVPAGAVTTDYLGVAGTVTLAVRRTGELGKVASINYTVTAGTATAGVHFTAVAATTLNFAAGEELKYIDVAIIGGSGDPDSDVTCVVTLATAVGCTIRTGANVTTITINDPA